MVHCLKSHVVPIWISFPYLLVHFICCKEALNSILVTIGKLLYANYGTTFINGPFVERVLIDYGVSQPLLPRFGIDDDDSNF